MKTYARSIWVLLLITLVSFILICCNYIYDISLAVFGSALVSLIISIIGYRHERTKALEAFFNATYKRIAYYNTYLKEWPIKNKCTFFINHRLMDFPSIGDTYASIHFFIDWGKSKYIFNEIYTKCNDMANDINTHYFDFSLYLNKTGARTEIINDFVEELENKLFYTDEQECDFSDKIMNELHGRYYKIMYGRNMMMVIIKKILEKFAKHH